MIELFTAAAMIVSAYSPAQASTSATIANNQATTSIPAYIASTTIQVASSTDSIKDVPAFIKNYYSDDPILVDIARCESAFRQYDKDGNILRGRVNNSDIGVMQINETYHLEKAKSLGFDITTTVGNAAYAKYLYDNEGAAPWSASQKCWAKPVAIDGN